MCPSPPSKHTSSRTNHPIRKIYNMNLFHTRLTTLILTALCTITATAAELETTTPVAAKTNGEKWWQGNCQRIAADIKKMEGKIDLAFVGDSITARWKGESWDTHWGSYRAVNMGIGGDRTQNVLWRLQNGQLDGYKAKLFVVMIGTNNLFDKRTEPADVAAGIKAIIELIQKKQPHAKILLLGIFPRGEKPNPGREKIAATNALISKYEGGVVHYMDIGAKFLEPDGTISKEVMKDFLHLGAKGYDVWAEAISKKVKELLAGQVKALRFSGETALVFLDDFCSISVILCCGLVARCPLGSLGRSMEVVQCRAVIPCSIGVRFPSCSPSSTAVATSGRPSARRPNGRTGV